MEIFELDNDSINYVATLMTHSKPEWWPTREEAYGQLYDINEAIKTVGWVIGEDRQHPRGWILCRELIGYRTLELECCGYDDHGEFKLEHKLGDLIETAEKYAKSKGYLTLRSGISSIGFNIHNQKIMDISHAIKNLQCDRVDYLWYLEHGFKVIGIQSNAYEVGFHLILLAKDLT
ncbi:hypothetical protein [Anaerorhabdus sp.]|uniref:hypothetical protein n=1 Tax=Anaerorhabdus sp. TaxID=1872524 RepID=UPI002FC7618B